MDQSAKKPTSCGEAWIAYCLEEDLYSGMPHSNWLDAAQAAHKAGWDAAMEAMKNDY